jgi:hypothetical protein
MYTCLSVASDHQIVAINTLANTKMAATDRPMQDGRSVGNITSPESRPTMPVVLFGSPSLTKFSVASLFPALSSKYTCALIQLRRTSMWPVRQRVEVYVHP